MDLSAFIIAVFCLIDDRLMDLGRLRTRGPAPMLSDSEVLTIELVGEFLGIDEDTELFGYFRCHYAHFFPNLLRVHRTTFSRQAANLWKAKECLWQELLAQTPHDPGFALADSFPLPACLFARAHRCQRFKGEAAFGKDTLLKQTFYGFRVHLRVCWPGVITRLSVAPANAHELSVLPELTECTSGLLVGDRNYHSPKIKEELAGWGVELLAAYSFQATRSHSRKERLVQPVSLPNRHRFFATCGALFHKAGVGAGSVAPGEPTAEEGPLSHCSLPAQPSDGQPTPSALEVARSINLHIRLASCPR